MAEEVKVIWKGGREFWMGESRYYLGEDNIIYVTEIGEADEKIAIEDKEAFFKLANLVDVKVKVLVDLNRAGKQSPEARKVRLEMMEHKKIGKVALWGLHPVARVIASFVMGITQKKDLRFFKTREEALAWLKESD